MSEKIPTGEIQGTTPSYEDQGYDCELGKDYPLYEVGQLEFATDSGNVYKIDRGTIFNTRTGETTNFSDEDQRVGKLVIGEGLHFGGGKTTKVVGVKNAIMLNRAQEYREQYGRETQTGNDHEQEAFDRNEQKIAEARKPASLSLFGGQPIGLNADPADILTAKLEFVAAKQERERLLSLSHKDPTASGKTGNQESSPSLRIADFERVVIKTESGNTYIIKRNPSVPGYLVANTNQGTIELFTDEQISNSTVVKGAKTLLGDGASTSPVASAQAWK